MAIYLRSSHPAAQLTESDSNGSVGHLPWLSLTNSRSAAGQAVTWCALSLCIANSLNQQYGAAAPGDEKPGPFFGDPML